MATAAPQTAMDMPQGAAPNPFSDPKTMQVYDQMRQSVSPKQFGDEILAGAAQTNPEEVSAFRSALEQIEMPPEALDLLNNMVDEILANPDQYAKIRAKYKEMGAPDEILPEQFDPNFFAALNMAVDQMIGEPAGVQAFAKGGIAELKPIAKAIAAYGRNGDTMLAHITPAEARMLRRRGGSGTINPDTGLPEFFLGKLFQAAFAPFKLVADAVKSFAKSTVGKVVTAVALGFFLGPAAASFLGVGAGTAGAMAISGFVGSAGATLLGGGSLTDALKAGAIGGLTAGVFSGLSGMPLTGGEVATGSFGDIVGGQVDKFTNMLSPSAAAPGPAVTASGVQAPAINASGQVAGLSPVSPTEFAPQDVLNAQGPAPASPDAASTDFASKRVSLERGPDGNLRLPAPPPPVVAAADTAVIEAPYNKYSEELANTPARNPFDPNNARTDQFTTTTQRDAYIANQGLDKPSYFDQAKDFYKNNISPSGIQEQGAKDALSKVQAQFPGVTQDQILNAPANSALGKAYASAMPGILSTYGPMAAVGIGTLAATGGFTPTSATASTLKPELMKPVTQRIAEGGNQRNYYLQNLPGVKYDQYGAPIFGQSNPFPMYDTGLGIASLNPKGYAEGGAVTRANFNEQAYRTAYPEVDAAILRGEFPNAYAYYTQYGKAEGHVATAMDKAATDKLAADKLAADTAKEAAQKANQKLVADAEAARKAAGYGSAYQNINAGLSYDAPAGYAAPAIAAREAAFKPTMDKFTNAQTANAATLAKPYTPTVVAQPYNNTDGYTNVLNPVAPPINYDTTPEFTAAQRVAIQNMPKDVSKMTAMEKAGIYVNLANNKLSDQQIRNAAEAAYGAQTTSDWKGLQDTVGQYQQAGSIGLTLPKDWTSKNAAQKIDYFNTQGTDAAALARAGIGQADIDYMTKNGLGAVAPRMGGEGSLPPRDYGILPAVLPPAAQPVAALPATYGGVGNVDPFYQQRMGLNAQVTARNSQGQNATPAQLAEMRRLSELSENDPGVNAQRDALNEEARRRGTSSTQSQQLLNRGGIASLGSGGYPRRTGKISGPGTATSDSIPAMLSDGEFVMTAKAVRGAGKGDKRAGAKRMYALMNQLEKNAARG